VIDDRVLGSVWTQRLQSADRCLEQAPARFSIHARKQDQAGVNRLAHDQPAEVAGILGHDCTVVSDAAGDHDGVMLAAPPDVKRVDGLVLARLVEAGRYLWRKTFIG
jgi:hypothetical protein